jgi:hypothetical protein
MKQDPNGDWRYLRLNVGGVVGGVIGALTGFALAFSHPFFSFLAAGGLLVLATTVAGAWLGNFLWEIASGKRG